MSNVPGPACLRASAIMNYLNKCTKQMSNQLFLGYKCAFIIPALKLSKEIKMKYYDFIYKAELYQRFLKKPISITPIGEKIENLHLC